MNRTKALSEWKHVVSTHLPHLSTSQAAVLALWNFGIVFTRSCGRVTVATFLALLLGRKRDAVEQQLYEWCIEARRKRGAKRRDLDVTTCFVPLLRWMISMWGDSLQIALTLDATTLSSRFAILVVSVVYRGNAIPVAWTIVPATEKRAWRRDWLRMLRLLRPGIPSDWTVLVLRDRGRYAGWLFRPIIRLGWHPFMRIKAGSTFRPPGKAKWRTLRTLVTDVGQSWQGRGTCFQAEAQLACTLVAWWGEGYQEPWFVTLRRGSRLAASSATHAAPRYVDAEWLRPSRVPAGTWCTVQGTPEMFYAAQALGAATGNLPCCSGASPGGENGAARRPILVAV